MSVACNALRDRRHWRGLILLPVSCHLLPVVDDQQLLRYSRHILLDELGPDAQEKFAAAHALVIGVGGLGAPVAQFLAAAGVGTMTLCDADRVDLTNL